MFTFPPFYKRLLAASIGVGLTLPLAAAHAQTGQHRATSNVVASLVSNNPAERVNISGLVGADTFYNLGYTGSHAIVASIDGGNFWTGHQALSQNTLLLPTGGPGTQLGEFDMHATAVASIVAGRPIAADPNAKGIAYGSTFWSGAVATDYIGENPYRLSFNISDASLITPYVTALQTGINGQRANVTTSSFGYTDDSTPNHVGTGVTGADVATVSIDGVARASKGTIVFSAGNTGAGNNRVTDPAGGYNTLSVGALAYGSFSDPYTKVANFSAAGPSDYQGPNPVAGQPPVRVANVRARVDIVAPGQNIYTASYTGATGGNAPASTQSPLPPSPPPDPNLPTDKYGSFDTGTSFAAPLVAGGATLLCDVGNANVATMGVNAVNGNVIKAVLLNSADKIPGWDNGQTFSSGVVTTMQALDYSSGAGRMNLARAYTQYTGGVTGGVTLTPTGLANNVAAANLVTTGWDYNTIAADGMNDYFFGPSLQSGTIFTATLNWYVGRTYDGLDADGNLTATDGNFTNLNLELWTASNGRAGNLVARSNAAYINTQHFSFALPQDGNYMLRVAWAGERYGSASSENYGLAWATGNNRIGSGADMPEPSAGWLVGAGVVLGAGLVRRRVGRGIALFP